MKKRFLLMLFFTTLTLCFVVPKNVNAQSTNSAIVNQVEYESLKVAIESANEGDTITLLKDITVSDADNFIANMPKNSILDLNGHTITISFMALIFTGNDITIRNGQFSSNASYSLWIGDENETKNAIIENITTDGGINIYNATNVVIRNTNAKGHDYYSVWIDNGASATIESGDYTTQGNNGLVGISSNNDQQHQLRILGGTFIANNDKFAVESPYLSPEILGGKFNIDVSKYVAEGYECKLLDGNYIVEKIIYKQEIELIPGNINNNDNKMTVEVSNVDEVKEVFLDTLNTTSDVDISNKNVKVIMDITQANINGDIKQYISTKLNNASIADYFDISINVIDINSNNVIGKLLTLNKKIKLNVTLPDKLKDVKAGYERKYYIVRKHGNNIDILDTKLSDDGNILTFETDKFSTYALVYTDNIIESNVAVESPDTSDNISLYITFCSISFIGIILCLYTKKNKKSI